MGQVTVQVTLRNAREVVLARLARENCRGDLRHEALMPHGERL